MRKLVILLFLISLSAKSQVNDMAIADSLYSVGNYTKAINAYAKMATAKTDIQIARAYNAIGNYEKATDQYYHVVTKYPDEQIALFEYGKLLLKTKDYSMALEQFNTLVNASADNPEYHYYIGESLRMSKKNEASIRAYKKVIVLDSTHLRSLFKLGLHYIKIGESNNALPFIDTGLRFYENDVAMINLKALALFNNGEYEKAIAWFNKVLELGEHKPHVYEKLGRSYYKNWEFEKAKGAYFELLAMDENAENYYQLAEVYQKNKQLDSATIYIKKGMDLQRPLLAEGYQNLSFYERDKDNLNKALEYLQLAHKVDVTNEMYYFRICTLYDRIGDDPTRKLKYYQNYLEWYKPKHPYMLKTTEKRIRELKEEIHM